MVMKVGEKAQDFELPDQNMKMRKLSEFFGKKDNTSILPRSIHLCLHKGTMHVQGFNGKL